MADISQKVCTVTLSSFIGQKLGHSRPFWNQFQGRFVTFCGSFMLKLYQMTSLKLGKVNDIEPSF